MSNSHLFFAISSLIISVVGYSVALYRWRLSELRRNEVLSWADDCIKCLQTLFLISKIRDLPIEEEKLNEIRLQSIFDTSILIERGRMFFKNEVVDNFGTEKLPAYRGYRPRILDHLVVAHQIARYWPNDTIADEDDRSELAAQCLKGFVSLAQMEVGRDRAASVEALKGGDDVHLQTMMTNLKRDREL